MTPTRRPNRPTCGSGPARTPPLPPPQCWPCCASAASSTEHVVAADAPDVVAGGAPSRLLAGVFVGEEVVLRAVDLDDQAPLRPDEVRFLAGHPHVDARTRAQQLQRPALRIGARSRDRQVRVALGELAKLVCPPAPAVAQQRIEERGSGGGLEADRFPGR